MRLLHHILSLFLLVVGARGQAAAPSAAVGANPPPAKQETKKEVEAPPVDLNFIPLPTPLRFQIREYQYQLDQTEIKIQKLQVQIEQLKQQQVQIANDISNVATDFARTKQLDFNSYELDMTNPGLRKKAQPPVIPSAPAKPILVPEAKKK